MHASTILPPLALLLLYTRLGLYAYHFGYFLKKRSAFEKNRQHNRIGMSIAVGVLIYPSTILVLFENTDIRNESTVFFLSLCTTLFSTIAFFLWGRHVGKKKYNLRVKLDKKDHLGTAASI